MNIEETKQSTLYAAGDNITMYIDNPKVFINDSLIVFPYQDDKKYILTVTIKSANS